MSEVPPPAEPVAAPVDSPALWNPNAAAAWSILFTPAFGAYLHSKNCEALGRTDAAKLNQKWFYGTLAFLAARLVLVFVPFLRIFSSWWVLLALLAAWYFMLGKMHADSVQQTYGDAYQRRDWVKPILIAFGCGVAYAIVAFILGLVLGVAVAVAS